MAWVTRTFTAARGGGAFCNGKRISVSTSATLQSALLVTGFGYEHDEAWSKNMEYFKHFTDVTRGVRRLGAAAVDLCHVASGIVDAYWEYRCAANQQHQLVGLLESGHIQCFDVPVTADQGLADTCKHFCMVGTPHDLKMSAD